MRKVLANGVHFHYQQYGEGSDVILVHGVIGNLAYWLLTVLPRLMERHRVTLYDLRGHGFSDMTPTGYTSGEMAEDLRGLMDGLEIQRAHIVGHSFGGTIALHHAARYPERVHSLVIADAGIPALRHLCSAADWPFYTELQRLLEPFSVKFPEDPDRCDLNELLQEFTKLPDHPFLGIRQGLPRLDRRVERLKSRTSCLDDVHVVSDLTAERICTVTVPTLAVYGEQSPFLPMCRYLEEHLPRCRALIQGGDHFFPAVAPEALADVVLEYFASLECVGSECADAPPPAGAALQQA